MRNFVLGPKEHRIIGYRWEVENNKVVCLIHGINEYAGKYSRLAKYFNEQGISIFSMDLRGHGKSFGTRGHCAPREAVLRDIDMLIDYIKCQKKDAEIIIYGHSMGGNITLDYRNRGKYRECIKGYIISAPWIRLVREISKHKYIAIKCIAKIFSRFKLNSSIDEFNLGNKYNVVGYKKDPLIHKYISAQCAKECYEIGEKLYSGKLYRKNSRPMLIMHGDKDKICSVEGSRRVAEVEGDNCEYIEWTGMDHEIHNRCIVSESKEVLEKVVEWINKL